MSEPLSSTEIEDVLSSIRRLVSDDLRPLQRAVPPNAGKARTEKLILTPALRVVQDDPSPAAPYRLHLGIPAPVELAGLDQIVAAVGAAVDAQPSEWEAEIGDVAPLAVGSSGGSAGEDWQAEDIGAPYFDDSIAIVDDDSEVMQPSDDDEDATQMGTEDAAPIAGWAQEDPEISGDLAADVSDIPALAQGTVEPDPAWADAAEASVIASLAADVMDDADNPDPASYANEPMLFDEEVLRELVRDILREELAGRMGERITRNIRKLVRAEIARSFATQEFE